MSRGKIFGRARLAEILRKKRGKKKVVFANGCFDLLHPGHVLLLEKAKAAGDLLVVAINSDRSVQKLKGDSRPLLAEKDRAKILAALACTDYVTVFPEETPAESIRLLKPDILVKGADYKSSEIVGRDDVKKVVRIPLLKSYSTSALLKKILRADE